jgi:hypothetical protein
MFEGQFHEAQFILRSANDAPLMPFNALTPEYSGAFFAFTEHSASMRISTAVRLFDPDNKFSYDYISVLMTKLRPLLVYAWQIRGRPYRIF